MKALTAAGAIEVWEAGRSRHAVDRALTLVAAATDGTRDELAALPVGRRDARLLRLRQLTFGERIEARARCPQCSEQLGVELACSELLAGDLDTSAPREHRIEVGAHAVTFRMADSFDLAAIAMLTDIEVARQLLLERCVLSIEGPGDLDATTLPEAIAVAVAGAMAALDPQAELLLDLECPACGHGWQSALDIATLLWSEVHAYARRSLLEVDLIARAYGWSEREILALSAARRATYLELVSG